MQYVNENIVNLHIKSTLVELELIDAKFDIGTKVKVIRKYLHNNPHIPGVLIMQGDILLTLISRKTLFEHISKPFGAELYSSRDMEFFLENYHSVESLLILPSSEEIVKALQIKLETPNHDLEAPIVVRFNNGEHKILDSYQLIVAQTYISSLAMDSLKEVSELKSDILSIAAHDLKNPLFAIIGYSKILEESIENEDPEIKDMIQHIKTSSEHMLKLIIDLLNSTVIESGKIQLKLHNFDLSELVMAIVYQNNTLADKKDQTIEYINDWDSKFYINGDSQKIREAIDNLINNAVKYSPYNSKIVVKITKHDSNIRFEVKDSGPGLPEEDLSKIFGKFQRLTAQPTGGENSTGLGLYIVKQIVDIHNGKIWIESKVGEGTTFFVEFPAVDLLE
jgi:signal transduction histidine kinase